MRRPTASRTSTAVAVVAAVVAVLAVMGPPGLSFSQNTAIHGGSPSEVFMLREDEGCAPDGVSADGMNFMPLQVELEEPSHLVAYFSFGWHSLDTHEQGQVNPELDGTPGGDGFEWRFTGNGTAGTISGTVMSSFPNIDAGTHTVDIYAAVNLASGGPRGRLFAGLSDCVLTVMVLPAAE